MLKAKEFNNIVWQSSIFTPSLSFLANKILGNILTKFSEIFDDTPTVIPLAQDAPAELPRIIIASSDKSMKVEMSPARINFFNILTNKEKPLDIDSFQKLTNDILNDYLAYTNAKVGRMAIVKTLGLIIDDPGKQLVAHFCKGDWQAEPFNRPEGFEIHSHKKYTLNGFNINSWVRCKTGHIDKNPAITVQQDINTFSEDIDKKEFSIEDINTFYKKVSAEQKDILRKYFPND